MKRTSRSDANSGGSRPPLAKTARPPLANAEGAATPIIILLKDQSMHTSGDREQSVEIDGVIYSHLVDPKVGLGRTRFQQASVIAPTGAEADAWATALCLMDPAEGIKRVDAKPGFACRIVTRPGDSMVSPASTRWPK